MRKIKKDPSKDLQQELENEYAKWHYLKEHGGNDPFWPDEINMNLVRNHIIYGKRQCEELLDPEMYPEEYFWELPPEVDSEYMAREEEIRENARISLETYRKDKDYLYLVKSLPQLNAKQRKKYDGLLGYVKGLEMAISGNALVDMRRHEHPEYYQERFHACRLEVEQLLHDKELPMGQLSIFNLFSL